MPLTGSLLELPIPAATQQQICEALCYTSDYEALRPYFKYYTDQCQTVFSVHGRKPPANTHQHVLNVAASFQNRSDRQTILQDLVTTCDTGTGTALDFAEAFENFINLAACLTLMVDIGELRNSFSGREPLIWSSGPLQDFLVKSFSDLYKDMLEHEGTKLGMSFTARNLDLLAGFRVELTTNLIDHLRFTREDRTVSIFHHASFLQCQQNNSLFPGGLVEETLRTLALLFPHGDRQTRKWYYEQDKPKELDLGVLKCGELPENYRQIEQYKFWHNRLVMLKEAFDEPQQKSLSQLWNDRREGNQWYALWVAIGITLFFGLVQSIEGALQVYKAYNPSS